MGCAPVCNVKPPNHTTQNEDPGGGEDSTYSRAPEWAASSDKPDCVTLLW